MNSTDNLTYPVVITPTSHVTSRRGSNGAAYLSFRAIVESAGRRNERTVRCFGKLVSEAKGVLRKDMPVKTRVAFDHFKGADGKSSQTMRIVELPQAA